MKNLSDLRPKSGLLANLPAEEFRFLSSIARVEEFGSGEVLFEEDRDADSFYILGTGKVGLELTAVGRPPVVIQTLGEGELIGVSWLFPPFRWSWRARAVTDCRVAAFDAAQVREAAETDAELHRWLMAAIARVAVTRLHNARLQLLDLYRKP